MINRESLIEWLRSGVCIRHAEFLYPDLFGKYGMTIEISHLSADDHNDNTAPKCYYWLWFGDDLTEGDIDFGRKPLSAASDAELKQMLDIITEQQRYADTEWCDVIDKE